jgi:hypothetical protein
MNLIVFLDHSRALNETSTATMNTAYTKNLYTQTVLLIYSGFLITCNYLQQPFNGKDNSLPLNILAIAV